MFGSKKALAGIALALFVAGIFLFNVPTAVSYEMSDRKASSVDTEIVSANNQFGMDLTKKLSDQEDGNVFISPFSISSSLLMAYNGAEGDTKQEMAEVLGVQGMEEEQVNDQYRDILDSLRTVDRQVSLETANSVWINEEYGKDINPEFKEDVRQSFDADTVTAPFDQETVNRMNGWVKENTGGNIDKLIERFGKDEIMFLVNAIYFKGEWTNKFEESDTKEKTFHAPSEDLQVQMMTQSEDFGYYENGDTKTLRLPYGREKVSMYVFLPRSEDQSLDTWLRNRSLRDINTAVAETSETKVRVELPRFETEYDRELGQDLKALGMEKSFTREADFTGMAEDQRLAISRVKHKAWVKVDEEGTEAAAATGTGIRVTSAPRTQDFVADRPFLFIIRDDRTGAMLFTGKIENPEQ